jgi:hypothetical protein
MPEETTNLWGNKTQKGPKRVTAGAENEDSGTWHHFILILFFHLRQGLPTGMVPSCFMTRICMQISYLPFSLISKEHLWSKLFLCRFHKTCPILGDPVISALNFCVKTNRRKCVMKSEKYFFKSNLKPTFVDRGVSFRQRGGSPRPLISVF